MTTLQAATAAANRVMHGAGTEDDVQLVAGVLLELVDRTPGTDGGAAARRLVAAHPCRAARRAGGDVVKLGTVAGGPRLVTVWTYGFRMAYLYFRRGYSVRAGLLNGRPEVGVMRTHWHRSRRDR